jgi:hypothetical protein
MESRALDGPPEQDDKMTARQAAATGIEVRQFLMNASSIWLSSL